MLYVLFLFWWGPSAATVTTLNMDSLGQCELVKKQLSEAYKDIQGRYKIACVAK